MLEAQSREYNEMTSQTQTAKEKANSQDGGRLAFVASVVLEHGDKNQTNYRGIQHINAREHCIVNC